MADSLSNDLERLRIDPKRRRKRSPIAGIAKVGLVAVVIGAGVLAFRHFQSGEMSTPEVRVGQVSAPATTAGRAILTTSGYVVTTNESNVGVAIAGRVSVVHVSAGDRVKKGQPLLELDAADEQNAAAVAGVQVKAARARAAAAHAKLEEHKKKVVREQALIDKGLKGGAALEDLKAQEKSLSKSYVAARAEADAVAAEASAIGSKLQKRRIEAPIDGVIMSRVPKVGEMVVPGSTPVLEIADLDSLVVETDVPEKRLNAIVIGTPCEITLEAYPDKRYACEAERVGTRVDRAKATVPVMVRFVDSTERVLPNMSAKVSFHDDKDKADGAAPATVPATAVVDRDGTSSVFVVENGVVHLRRVEVGRRVGSSFELKSGPPPETRVVLGPAPDLRDRQKVSLATER